MGLVAIQIPIGLYTIFLACKYCVNMEMVFVLYTNYRSNFFSHLHGLSYELLGGRPHSLTIVPVFSMLLFDASLQCVPPICYFLL